VGTDSTHQRSANTNNPNIFYRPIIRISAPKLERKETKRLASRRRRRTTTTIKFKIGLWTSKLGNSYMEVPGDPRGSNGFNRRSSSTLHRHLSRSQIYIYIGRKKRLSVESLFSAAQRSRTPLLKYNKIHCTRPTFLFLGSRLVWRSRNWFYL
jgi:hypothetical protein